VKLYSLVGRRLLQLIPLAFLATSATFLLASLIPGDFFTSLEASLTVRPETVAQLRQQYGMNEPAHVQYGRWLQRCLHLDLGYSFIYSKPVTSVVARALANTLWIGLPVLVLALIGGVTLGGLHAVYQRRPLGYLLDFLSTVALSLPSMILGLAALLLAARTQWFPLGSMESSILTSPSTIQWLADRLHHLLLPILCLTIPVSASIERIQYAATQTMLNEPHIRAARARGLTSRRVFFRYLVRPSLNPVLSTLGPMIGAILSGSLVLEWIFSWPGLGKVTYDALLQRDVFLLLGCVAGGSLVLVLGNLSADILLFVLDPRTRESLGSTASGSDRLMTGEEVVS
jgi:peptide/nickel transport system permease protein